MKEKFSKFIESWLPLLIGFTCAGISLFIYSKVNLLDNNFDKLLDAIINFDSITIGFIGVLLGILFSIRNTTLIEILFKHKTRALLKKYFSEAFIAGALLLSISIVLYLRNNIPSTVPYVVMSLFALWGCFLSYTIACSIRIIVLMIKIIFNDVDSEQPKEDKMDDAARQALKDRHRR